MLHHLQIPPAAFQKRMWSGAFVYLPPFALLQHSWSTSTMFPVYYGLYFHHHMCALSHSDYQPRCITFSHFQATNTYLKHSDPISALVFCSDSSFFFLLWRSFSRFFRTLFFYVYLSLPLTDEGYELWLRVDKKSFSSFPHVSMHHMLAFARYNFSVSVVSLCLHLHAIFVHVSESLCFRTHVLWVLKHRDVPDLLLSSVSTLY